MNTNCPNCGYCSHCGRGNNYPYYPTYQGPYCGQNGTANPMPVGTGGLGYTTGVQDLPNLATGGTGVNNAISTNQ